MKPFDAAVMHDFFVDRLVHTRKISNLTSAVESKGKQGGGSVHDVRQQEVSGGNAVNLARALALLGARVFLVTHSDEEHMALLRGAFSGLDVELSVKPSRPGLTVAIEEEVNVMVSDSGGAEDFPPSMLAESDWEKLRCSRIVCSVNWAANRSGTRLLAGLRERLGRNATLYLDPSDVRDRFAAYRSLARLMRRGGLVNWLSVNEYEGASTARALGIREKASGALCSRLSEAIGGMVDLHTETACYTASAGRVTERRTAWHRPRRLTGAGDVWDAASVFGFISGMGDDERLGFANAAARLYVTDVNGRPPTYREVRDALP